MVVRAAEYGNDRIILGAHYAMDVVGGRTLAMYDLAQLLANKPDYVGLTLSGVKIDDFQMALAAARDHMTSALENGCGGRVAVCALRDQSRFADPLRNLSFYEVTQTYRLPVVVEENENKVEDVAKLAPEAGYLLTTAFPYLTLREADDILTQTQGPGGDSRRWLVVRCVFASRFIQGRRKSRLSCSSNTPTWRHVRSVRAAAMLARISNSASAPSITPAAP